MDNETEWTLKRLVQQLELPTTTVFRQLSTLVEHGYLIQDPVRKSYRVGPHLLLLASTILSHSDLRTVARPELEKLSATVKRKACHIRFSESQLDFHSDDIPFRIFQ